MKNRQNRRQLHRISDDGSIIAIQTARAERRLQYQRFLQPPHYYDHCRTFTSAALLSFLHSNIASEVVERKIIIIAVKLIPHDPVSYQFFFVRLPYQRS